MTSERVDAQGVANLAQALKAALGDAAVRLHVCMHLTACHLSSMHLASSPNDYSQALLHALGCWHSPWQRASLATLIS
jgi:hypothetical protein